MIKKILSLLFAFSLYAVESDDLVINSDKVNIADDSNVIFSENISIDSGVVLINANKAIYDNDTKIIEITGNPSSLKSSEKIIFSPSSGFIESN